MYENGVDEQYLTAIFTFATDDEHEAALRKELTDGLIALADALGHDVEIHDGDALLD